MMRGLLGSTKLFASKLLLFSGRRTECGSSRAYTSLIPINTICLGQSVSMASLLLAAGAKGQRRSLPNATIMIHQPSGGRYSGQAKDIAIHTKHSVRVWDALNELYAKHTGQSIEVIQKNMDRDYFMTAQEAKEFGMIDEVIDQRPMTFLVSDAAVGNNEGSKDTVVSNSMVVIYFFSVFTISALPPLRFPETFFFQNLLKTKQDISSKQP